MKTLDREFIIQLRAEGFTQSDIGELLGVPQSSISYTIRGLKRGQVDGSGRGGARSTKKAPAPVMRAADEWKDVPTRVNTPHANEKLYPLFKTLELQMARMIEITGNRYRPEHVVHNHLHIVEKTMQHIFDMMMFNAEGKV